jgi:hypothetical protein
MDCRIQGALRFVASSSICGLFIKNIREKKPEQLHDDFSFPYTTACPNESYITIKYNNNKNNIRFMITV